MLDELTSDEHFDDEFTVGLHFELFFLLQAFTRLVINGSWTYRG